MRLIITSNDFYGATRSFAPTKYYQDQNGTWYIETSSDENVRLAAGYEVERVLSEIKYLEEQS